PHAPGGVTTRARAHELTRLLSSLPKPLLSRQPGGLVSGPARRPGADLPQAAQRPEAEPGGAVVPLAGAGPPHGQMGHGLLLDARRRLRPVRRGRGRPLFGAPLPGQQLALLGARPSSSGVVLVRYARVRDASPP